MNFFVKIGSYLGEAAINLDVFVGNFLPSKTFSGFSKIAPETISSKCGKEQAYVLLKKWDRVSKNFYPIIPLHHPLGQIADNLCIVFERYHCLKHITWDKGEDMIKKYPEIKLVRDAYLKLQGIILES